jgi:hypothetical protein
MKTTLSSQSVTKKIWARLDRVGWRHGLEPRGGEKKTSRGSSTKRGGRELLRLGGLGGQMKLYMAVDDKSVAVLLPYCIVVERRARAR